MLRCNHIGLVAKSIAIKLHLPKLFLNGQAISKIFKGKDVTGRKLNVAKLPNNGHALY